MITGRLLSASVILLTAACQRPAKTPDDVTGTYAMHAQAADTLRLSAGGRYVRTFARPGESTAVDSGRWFLANHGKLVGLRDFKQRWHGIHDWMDPTFSPLTPAIMGLAVERNWRGEIRLGWQSQFGFTYLPVHPGESQ